MANRIQAAVVGIGHSPVHRRDDVPLGLLALDACRQAIADAGLKPADIDGICSNPEQGFEGNGIRDGFNVANLDSIARGLGMDTRWALRVFSSTTVKAMAAAIHAVSVGACNHALVFRAIHNPAGRYGHVDPKFISGDGTAGMQGEFSVPYGVTPPANAAFLATQYFQRYGATREDLGAFITRNRDQALLWERGFWSQHRPERLTLEAYLGARMVAEPLTMYDCDLPVQACGAWVVTTPERARDLPHPPAYVLGVSVAEPAIPNRPWTLEDFEAGARKSGRILYENSGLEPKDVDVANLYDGFSIFPPIWLEGLGFAEPGEGLKALGKGVAPIGNVALNTSSGNLGHGRMPGVAQVTESVLQIMGRSGPRQIEDARVTLASVGVCVDGHVLAFGKEPA
ncbi:MAG: thiolase family protein [Sphingobium sp.]